MAFEKALWQRVKNAGLSLRKCSHGVHLCRIENSAGEGHPDVEGSINGNQVWLELKSEERPKRPGTSIRFKTRPSQAIWHTFRRNAGAKDNFILAQVGEAHEARLYLIPGDRYNEIIAPEPKLAEMSLCRPTDHLMDILLIAARSF